jgi:hypothetical protein
LLVRVGEALLESLCGECVVFERHCVGVGEAGVVEDVAVACGGHVHGVGVVGYGVRADNER